jgi:hypothetical protein
LNTSVGGVPSPGGSPRLALTLGFATQESSDGEGIRDQFTVVLQDFSRTLNVAVATLDAEGAHFLPLTPGYLATDRAEAAWAPKPLEPPPGVPAIGGHATEHTLQFPIPVELEGQPLTLRLTLFDNQDELNSVGWIGEAVWVPEPEAIPWLCVVSVAGLLLRRRAHGRTPRA